MAILRTHPNPPALGEIASDGMAQRHITQQSLRNSCGVESVRQFHYVRRMAASTPSQRMLRAGELIRHALVSVIQRGETSDPELDKLAPTITEVQLSPDLKIATAYVRSLIIGKEQQALEALNRNRKYIRGLLAPKLDMKYMPDIRFRIDTALDYASKIDELLQKPEVQQDLKKE